MLRPHLYRPETIARYQRGAAGKYVDGFIRFLARDGYTRSTAGSYLKVVPHLGNWMTSTGVPIRALDESVLDQFARHLPTCRCPAPRGAADVVALAAARHFLRYLRSIGVAKVPALANTSRHYTSSRFIPVAGLHLT